MFRELVFAGIALFLASELAMGAPDKAATRPVLVELFTSESCSSCPPADAYLGVLRQRTDVLPLSFHVDYWNDLGWVDHFSSPAFTARQRNYSALIRAQVYTPQAVIDGREDALGSDRESVEAAIRRAREHQLPLSATLEKRATGIEVNVEKTPLAGTGLPAKVLLVTFDPVVSQAIGAGENRGKTIAYHNVVRSLRQLSTWNGAALHLSEPLHSDESGSEVALLIQDQSGTILGVVQPR